MLIFGKIFKILWNKLLESSSNKVREQIYKRGKGNCYEKNDRNIGGCRNGIILSPPLER